MVKNTKVLRLKQINSNHGSLVPVEILQDIPFEVRRIYYIFGVEDGARRGYHSHRKLEQVLICVHGAVTILVRTPEGSEDVVLDDPAKALYIGPMVWREMYNFSPDATLLVLASEHYEESDYIRDYAQYEPEASGYFNQPAGHMPLREDNVR
jgi:dTDP-4-dehydrorhamnose 3,5-epimerase-like enzyme